MLNRKTILLMVSAIALFGLVALIEGNRSVVGDRTAEPTADADAPLQGDGELLFDFEEEDVDAVEVERDGETLAFEKLENGSWEMSAPEVGEAEGGAIAFLLSQITSTSVHTLSADTSDLRDFGLQNPDATVRLTANDTPYQLTVGGEDFSGNNLYVRADPPARAAEGEDQTKVHVVSGSMRNAVNRPTQDWLITEDAEATDSEEALDNSTEEIEPVEQTE